MYVCSDIFLCSLEQSVFLGFFFFHFKKLSSFTQNVNAKLFINRINMDFSKNKLCGVTIKWSAPSELKFTFQHQACWQLIFAAQHKKRLKQSFQELLLWGGLAQSEVSCALFRNRSVSTFPRCTDFPPTVLQGIRMLRKAGDRVNWLYFLADLNSLTFKHI